MPYKTLSSGKRQYYGGNYKTERDLGLYWVSFKNGSTYMNHLFDWRKGGKSLCGLRNRRGSSKRSYHGYTPDCEICQRIFEDRQE